MFDLATDAHAYIAEEPASTHLRSTYNPSPKNKRNTSKSAVAARKRNSQPLAAANPGEFTVGTEAPESYSSIQHRKSTPKTYKGSK